MFQFDKLTSLSDWNQQSHTEFTRHDREEEITIHLVGMQDGTYTGVVVYEIVDAPVLFDDFEVKAGEVPETVNDIIIDLKNEAWGESQ